MIFREEERDRKINTKKEEGTYDGIIKATIAAGPTDISAEVPSME
jgi:hypothetical protein